ncbi:Lacal_2735 family protein [Mesonia aquimarina]|uniref:Lacal_2735 family protein n=1 Tax=Mesonia aquimarina TaxID=1504967 RepID=UPI000EF63130|nr:Lacal_2735 family protein [Mesonia aquimarina]
MKFLEWLKGKNRRQKLKEKYCSLMRRAYEIAPKNKKKSDYLNKKARNILRELKKLENRQDFSHNHSG